MNKDSVYIIKQPEHTILTVMTVPNIFPLENDVHESISKLNKISDIIFIFRSPSLDKINIPKFSNLYNVCGYYIAEQNNPGEAALEVLVYGYEVLRKHTSYLTLEIDYAPGISSDKALANIQTVNASSIVKPIFEGRELNSEEFFDIYKKPEKTEKETGNSWWGWWKNTKNEEDETDKKGMWTRWTSISNAIWLRSRTIGLLKDKYEDPEFNQYSNTFTDLNPDKLLISLLKKLGIDNINASIETLNVNSLKSNEV